MKTNIFLLLTRFSEKKFDPHVFNLSDLYCNRVLFDYFLKLTSSIYFISRPDTIKFENKNISETKTEMICF